MPNFKETDSIQSIVDGETFSWWIGGYRQVILTDPNTKKLCVDLTSESPLGGFNCLSIQRLPWTEVPQSLQEVIAMQYEATTQPDQEKNVVVKLEGNTISFTLGSSTIHRDVDIYGENNVSGGVKLLMGSGKAQWEIFKAPAILQSILDTFNQTPKPSLAESVSRTEYINNVIAYNRQAIQIAEIVYLAMTSMDATLPQLHNVARLLARERSRVFITRLTVLPPPM